MSYRNSTANQTFDPVRAALVLLTMAIALAVAAFLPAVASADFGVKTFDGGVVANPEGDAFTQAEGHPYQVSNTIEYNEETAEVFGSPVEIPDGSVRDIHVDLPPGFVGDPLEVPYCGESEVEVRTCPVDSQVGYITLHIFIFSGLYVRVPVFNMKPPPGSVGAFGFNVLGGAIIHMNVRLRSEDDYGLTLDIPDISQTVSLYGQQLILWGRPSDPRHDQYRGPEALCVGSDFVTMFFCLGGEHSASSESGAFLTLPGQCSAGPLTTTLRTDPWQDPNDVQELDWVSHMPLGFPAPAGEWGEPQGVTDCGKVPFNPDITVQPTTDRAETPTGLNVTLRVPDAGFKNPDGIAQANLKKAEVRLPEGMSINPSAGEGLGVCTPADYARETATSNPAAGCPNSSKIGTVQIVTPALQEPLDGSLYIAQQDNPATTKPGAENPFDSLLAMYIVARNPVRGVVVKQAGEVSPDPKTGRLVTTFDGNPQVPFSEFTLRFREGQRSPLVSPPACGTYTTDANFSSWSAADPDHPAAAEIVEDASSFRITEGVGGSPCPTSNAARGFKPALQAGTLNNDAGSYSPFNVRMTRNDGEQEITSFSADLPPGLSGRLAGVPSCSDADIAKTATKTGLQEKADPSCPAASQVGRTLVGAGVGSVLAYAPGKVYLAGPYHGSPLSIAAITSATVGPFDLGTVVVRSALRIDPDTAQVHVDSAGSDPIPHILRGIPLHVRDIRVYMDRPDFTLNPTNCSPFAVATELTGSGADFANPADDVAAAVDNRFQVANCANLGFKPKLAFKLKGGTHRGDYPALTAVLKARPGDANIARTAVTLPHSEFLAQEHIRTICTRVQFAADNCPAAAIYGHAKAVSPLLDEPLQGPVYLRSSSNPLPDLVADLNGRFDVVLAARIDSVNQGIRNRFELVPDAPVTKFTLKMQGGKKGLLVNSRNLCKGRNFADVRMVGQNGKLAKSNPVVANSCGDAGKAAR
jgi:hypothetical protein